MTYRKKQEILALSMGENDAGAKTIREYLVCLAEACFLEGEGFSGKRPFGNSGWERELYLPLVKAGVIVGEIDEDGKLDRYDSEAGRKIIASLFATLKGTI